MIPFKVYVPTSHSLILNKPAVDHTLLTESNGGLQNFHQNFTWTSTKKLLQTENDIIQKSDVLHSQESSNDAKLEMIKAREKELLELSKKQPEDRDTSKIRDFPTKFVPKYKNTLEQNAWDVFMQKVVFDKILKVSKSKLDNDVLKMLKKVENEDELENAKLDKMNFENISYNEHLGMTDSNLFLGEKIPSENLKSKFIPNSVLAKVLGIGKIESKRHLSGKNNGNVEPMPSYMNYEPIIVGLEHRSPNALIESEVESVAELTPRSITSKSVMDRFKSTKNNKKPREKPDFKEMFENIKIDEDAINERKEELALEAFDPPPKSAEPENKMIQNSKPIVAKKSAMFEKMKQDKRDKEEMSALSFNKIDTGGLKKFVKKEAPMPKPPALAPSGPKVNYGGSSTGIIDPFGEEQKTPRKVIKPHTPEPKISKPVERYPKYAYDSGIIKESWFQNLEHLLPSSMVNLAPANFVSLLLNLKINTSNNPPSNIIQNSNEFKILANISYTAVLAHLKNLVYDTVNKRILSENVFKNLAGALYMTREFVEVCLACCVVRPAFVGIILRDILAVKDKHNILEEYVFKKWKSLAKGLWKVENYEKVIKKKKKKK